MINTDMRLYDYYTLGQKDAYGQAVAADMVAGQIKMAINIASQSIQDNILYQNAQYIGLTHAEVDDTFVIQYGEERLKVLYVNPKGRYTQVYMARACE
jgi:hypothetical protein